MRRGRRWRRRRRKSSSRGRGGSEGGPYRFYPRQDPTSVIISNVGIMRYCARSVSEYARQMLIGYSLYRNSDSPRSLLDLCGASVMTTLATLWPCLTLASCDTKASARARQSLFFDDDEQTFPWNEACTCGRVAYGYTLSEWYEISKTMEVAALTEDAVSLSRSNSEDGDELRAYLALLLVIACAEDVASCSP